MEDLTKLIQLVSEESPGSDLPLRLHSDASVKSGLLAFHCILSRGVDVISDEDARLGLQSWTDAQIHAVLSIAFPTVAATRSLSVDQVEPLLMAVMQKLLEFAIVYLEHSNFDSEDFGIQNYFLHLLEMAFADSSEKISSAPQLLNDDSTLNSLLLYAGDQTNVDWDKHMTCNVQGCSRQEKPLDHLLMSLASDGTDSERQMLGLIGSGVRQNIDKLTFLSQHWALVHLGYIQRLILMCKDLIIISSDQKTAGNNLRQRLSLSLRTLKLLRNLSQYISYVEHESAILEACSSYADVLPRLFSLRFEFVNSSLIEGSFESLILRLFEEFLHVLHSVFGNTVVFQNIQACVAASTLSNLASIRWIYEKSASNVKPPLAYFPRVVLFLLKVIHEVSGRSYQSVDWNSCGKEPIGSGSGVADDTPTYSVHSEKVHLLKKYASEDLMNLIFPASSEWLDGLIHLISFLFSEGVKLGQKIEKSYSDCPKTSCPAEEETAASHEEEALFGDLFCEGGRSASSADDPLPGVVNSLSNRSNTAIDAASELLNFLKLHIFSPDWHPSVFGNACKRLDRDHIDIILSITDGQLSNPSDGTPGSSGVPQGDKKIGHARDLCFGLLHNLLNLHALSNTLEDYLVQKILKIENGMFIYNGWTLTLLAHILLSKVGSEGSLLRSKLYEDFNAFIVEKVNAIQLGSPSMQELLRTLPSVFHIEILLAAFHLSSQEEKVTIAKSLLCSVNALTQAAAGYIGTHLSCWALLVSRLVLLLRHMLFHPETCPPTLFLELRTKLREASAAGTHSSENASSYLSSCASVVLNGIIFSWLKGEPSINSLINQLFDTVALRVSRRGDDQSVDCVLLHWGDVCACFSKILGMWKDKRAGSIEDLIVERYLFGLCWDLPATKLTAHSNFLWSKPENMEISDMGHFLQFSHTIFGDNSVQEGLPFLGVAFAALKQLHVVPLPGNSQEIDWNFLRGGMWLSLVLSMLNTGIRGYSKKEEVHVSRTIAAGNISRETGYVASAVALVSSVVEAGQVAELMIMLSSLLNRILQAFQKFFVATFSNDENDTNKFSALLLLVHCEFEKSIQDALLEKGGISVCMLEFLNELLTKIDVAVEKRSTGYILRALWQFISHGFPPLVSSPSAVLLSCMLSIKEIICTMDAVLGMNVIAVDACLDPRALQQIVWDIMTVKFNKIFGILQDNCEALLSRLGVNFGGLVYADMFLLKQVEGFLKDVNSSDSCDSGTYEWLIDKYIGVMDKLRKDPSKFDSLKSYFGVDSNRDVKTYGFQHGDLMVLMDSLDNCYSEPVNVKVVNFFIDILSGELCSDTKLKLHKKFISMDLLSLSKWLENRLLGCSMEFSEGLTTAKGVSVSLRDSTMNFLLYLVASGELSYTGLHNHLFKALLHLLDGAFLLSDIHMVKSYFQFVAHFVKGEDSVKLLLERTVMLMEKIAGDECSIPGLQFIFSFLGSILREYSSSKNPIEKSSGKSLSGTGIDTGPGSGHVASKPVGSRKGSDALMLSSNQESGSTSFDCDATSIDEDEDDETSDGEVTSMDKEEEDDANTERALASKVCTFTSSGSNFMEQHWYFCYTCDLTVSKGCCSVCAKVCHRGHRVVYSRLSRFFCDCGAGGVRGSSCQCLKPRKFTGGSSAPVNRPTNLPTLIPLSEDGNQIAESDSDLAEDLNADGDSSLSLSIPGDLQEGIPLMLEDLNVEGRVLDLCKSLMPSITSRRDSSLSKKRKIILGEDKVMSYGVDLLQLKKAYKSGSLDLKIKADYTNSKELKSHLASCSLVKSLLSVSLRGRLAVGEGDKVAIFDVGQLIGQATVAPVTADKTNVKPLSKNVVRFEIVHLSFNTSAENYLAVAGYEDCQVVTLNSRGEVTDRLAIELALQGAYIRRVDWVPGSQVQLLVVTNKFVKIYDLSQDNISPLRYFTLADEMIVDAALCLASHGKMFLVVLSEYGTLYRLELSKDGNIGATPLKEIVQVPNQETCSKGLSLYFSSTYRLLFVSYHDGTALIGQLSPDAQTLVELSAVYEEERDAKRPAGLHHWKELLAGSGLFSCMSSVKSNSALAVSMVAHDLTAQSIRHALDSSAPVVGITAYKPLSKDKIHCLVLHEDGSLQIYSYASHEVDASANAASEKIKKLGAGILNNRAFSGSNPEFPLDFFEKTICITADVKLGGDAVRSGDSEGAKQSLASEEGCLESPSLSGFKISVSNSNPDIVMVGFRVHAGHTSPNHIPSNLTIFQRVIKLDEGMRSWYDVPFTVAESLLADEEFFIAVGPTFNGTALPRIDALEVYGRSKDEFGWKEKMDAVLDMEARVLGNKSAVVGRGRKFRSMQSASAEEQVVADGLRLLSRFYSICQMQEFSRIEDLDLGQNKLKCKHILEDIFQSDREPLLQGAARRVLQALFPKKEIYYQVKDTMRLFGVVKSVSVLSSRLGVGGGGSFIIEEFTAQMHAVSKIALHRRANLANFLESNGSEVVDGLMQLFWGILDLEQLDAQTMNNIVISSVDLIYCYAECLALHGKDYAERSVAPAIVLIKQLLFSPNYAIQTASSLAISSRLLQVPFPRQTMLAADDAAENSFSTAAPAETGGTNSQLMIEEDSITSSVQYCCDGCSTVPILRHRWHCTICPDFDLCEACYEVLGADQLPAPHTKDHRMTAIPIEVDSLGGHNHEIPYSTDDATESNLLPTTAPVSAQTSAPPIHVLEPNESGEFSSSVTDSVLISASKREVNSLLLSELLEQLKGWMETTSGVQAIPVLQLFYRLSSAVNGPFIGSSKPGHLDLEKLINWFINEIKINKPFVASTRSSFGEVTVLVFMFFTLMLRNWHQPGSDSSVRGTSATSRAHDRSTSVATSSSSDDHEKNDLASQLHRACNALRQQAFINYLMDILQQLVHVFKCSSNFENSHATSHGPGCGALLSVRRDLPAGNFSPFFSDTYVKSHHADIFIDFHRLLLENTFRLLYALVRPEKQEKTGEKEKVYRSASSKYLKLDGYQDVLCSYINNAQTSFVRRYARRLFLHLCGSKTHYYSFRDAWQFSNEVRKLYKHVNKSGGFHNPASYERSLKIIKCLSTMAEVAASRPRNWQKYCLRHVDVLSFLLDGVFCFGEESVIQILKLISLAFYFGKDTFQSIQKAEPGEIVSSSAKPNSLESSKKKKKGEEGGDYGLEKSYMDMEAAVDLFTDKNCEILKHFIDCFLLEWNSSSVRSEARFVLLGLWHQGKQSVKESLLMSLMLKVRYLPMYGQNIVEYTELVVSLLGGKTADTSAKLLNTELVDRCLTAETIKCIFEALHSQNELLANHPNSRIYNTLSGLVEFDGYYLESEPCVACSSPEVPYSRMKLENLKSETKFTDKRIIVKCTGSYTIQTVTMNVHDARKSKSVKVLNLYYNNRPVADLSELKNNWTLWKRAKSCHLAFNQTELKVEFPIPITACNFMIELDSFYENLQALSLEPLQCPRCSRPVTDKHGICSNCHENAYQCRQCRNINYENLDSFLCNECGYSKYGRFEFNFMAKPSFTFDEMENDDDMKRGLAAIESESENAHRRYQQLLGFKKSLMKIVSSIGENEMDSQQKDSVQQMMVSLPGPSCKINRKIALLGVLYGEKCKAAFDSVSKSVQTLQGLRRVLMNYLHQKNSDGVGAARFVVSRSPNNCYGCAANFVTQCLDLLHVLSKHPAAKKQLVSAGILSELFQNNIHQGPKNSRVHARAVLCAFSEGDVNAVTELNSLIQKKVIYCIEHHRSMDIALAIREELLLLSEICSLTDEFWESRLRLAFQLLFSSIKLGAKHPAISEHVILPCLKIISQACTPPKPDAADKEPEKSAHLKEDKNVTLSSSSGAVASSGKSVTETLEKNWDVSNKVQDIPLLSYSEWEKGASYLDFVRRQYQVSQAVKFAASRSRSQRQDYLALKYALRWKRARKASKGDLPSFELGSWVKELVLSACAQSIRSEMCMLISLLSSQRSSRQFRLLNLLMGLLPSTLSAGESAAEYFELLFRMIDSEDARLFLTARGCLTTICKLIAQEVGNVESLERSLHIDISQGFILHKFIEMLGKFLEVPNIRSRFMRDNLLSEILEALIVIRGLIVQKTKLIRDCNRLLKDLLDSLLLENSENKRQFIRACINGLQIHGDEKKGRTCLFILEQLCNLICPSKTEAVYLLVLNKAHTQEEFIRGSMTKNPYSSSEIGPLMRDVKNKICHELDLIGLLEDDYSMELLVAGNIISLDLSVAQVYEQVWKKSSSQSSSTLSASALLSSNSATGRDCPLMTVTYRLQGLDGEATEPMIKELDEDREESQDPEVEFAIAGAVRECGGLEIILNMIQRLRDDFKINQEQLVAVLNLLMHCCKIKENRRALLRLGALGLLLETARRAFSVEAMEPAEGILLIVESLTLEANESDGISITESVLTVNSEATGTGEQAKKIVLTFLERLCHPLGKKSNKQRTNTEMVARILPYLTYGEPAAMEALVQHFNLFLQNWCEFDRLQKQQEDNPKDENIAEQATKQRLTVESFVRVSESLRTSSCGERLKDIILEKGITSVAVKYLRESFAVAEQAGFKSRSEWTLALKLPSVPLILSMLRGLSMGHLPTQKCIDEGGILSLLHVLESVPGENEIGVRAENLLDTLANREGTGDGFLEDKVRSLRHATKDEMRRLALKKREQILQGYGMRQELAPDGGERIIMAHPILEGLDDVEEEDGLACMVCREGYGLRPNDLLGVYSYSKRVNLGVGTSGSSRGECVYTTVSSFNVIHFQCHLEAKRADAALKNPKKEWEGATLRNNESLCNSLFPLKSPFVPLTQYVRYVDQYWDNLNTLGRAEGSRLRLLTYDIVLMLARFATGASFSAESRGGGRESNSKFLPFMVQMAYHLLDQGSPSQRRAMAKAVDTYLSSSTSETRPSTPPGTQSPGNGGTEETVQFMMVDSLLSESYESWVLHRRPFLLRGIYHAYMQHAHGRSSRGGGSGTPTKNQSAETGGAGELLSIIRPMLVYMGLIEQLQRYLKKSSGAAASVRAVGTSSGSGGGEEGMESWEVVMKDRLLNMKEMVGFSKELLSWLDDMNSAADLQEAFDVIGALSDVLSGGFTRCEDFVNAAINNGKS